MTKLVGFVFRIALILALFLSAGCAAVTGGGSLPMSTGREQVVNLDAIKPGQLIQLGKFQTMHLVRHAVDGAWWATILQDPSGTKFIIVWPLSNKGVAFYMWDSAKVAGIRSIVDAAKILGFNKGQVGDIDDVSSLVSSLQNKGWTIVAAEAIAESVKTGITSALSAAAKGAGAYMENFYIIPVDPSDPWNMEKIENSICYPDGLEGENYCDQEDT